MTTPEQSPGDDDDIWDTSSDHDPIPNQQEHHETSDLDTSLDATDYRDPEFRVRGQWILSDLPALRRQHMTDGYREGLAVGKARVMQSGFDSGYPIGVEVGLKVGNIIGVLEGVIAALTSAKPRPGRASEALAPKAMTSLADSDMKSLDVQRDGKGGLSDSKDELSFAQSLCARAHEELKVSELLKGLDDAKIAAIPDARIGENDESGTGIQNDELQQAVQLPSQIEEVLVKWETLVLGALRKGGADSERMTEKDAGTGVEI